MIETYSASKELQVVMVDPFEKIIPRSDKRKGYFSFSNSDLQLEKLSFCILTYRVENLTIQPYFVNTDFVVMDGLVLNPELMEEYGGSCTEVFTLKFTGRSKDSLSRYLGKIFKAAIAKSITEDTQVNLQDVLPLNIEFSFEKNFSQENKAYFSVVCDKVSSLPEIFEDVELYELTDIICQRNAKALEPDKD